MNKRFLIVCLLSVFPLCMWAINATQAKEVVDNYYQSLAMYAQNPASNPKLVTQWFTTENVVYNDIYGRLYNDYSSHNKCAIKDYITYVGGYYNNYGAKLYIGYNITGNVYGSTVSNGYTVSEYLVYVTKSVVGNGSKRLNFTTYEKIAIREINGKPLIHRIERMNSPYQPTSTAQSLSINSVTIYNDPIGDYDDRMTTTLYAYQMRWLVAKVSLTNSGDPMTAEFKIIIKEPDGSISKSTNSPTGYSMSNTKTLTKGTNTFYFSAWGNNDISIYTPGNYRYEIYYNNQLLNSKSFTVKKDKWFELLESNVLRMTGNKTSTGICSTSSNGYGLYITADRSFYFGWMTTSGYLDGYALLISSPGTQVANCSNAQYYFGPFEGWSKSGGKGTCYTAKGDLIYYGPFKNNSPSDVYPVSGYNSFKFKILEYDTGNYYVGELENGKRDGNGLFIWTDGYIWYGTWKDNQRDGYGILFYPNGTIKRGYWKHNEYSTTSFE